LKLRVVYALYNIYLVLFLFFVVQSFDISCDFMFYDLAIHSRSYKINWVESFDLGCDLMFYDLAIPFWFDARSRFWQPLVVCHFDLS